MLCVICITNKQDEINESVCLSTTGINPEVVMITVRALHHNVLDHAVAMHPLPVTLRRQLLPLDSTSHPVLTSCDRPQWSSSFHLEKYLFNTLSERYRVHLHCEVLWQ